MKSSTNRKSTVDEGSLDQYLRDISVFPLINREKEVELAKRIRMDDQDALDTLVRSNLRFVVSVAKKYQNQGVSLSDLINEGNLGLIRAAHKFDETKGIKFISYAVWWIRQSILQALAEQSRIVRVPLNRAGTLHRIGKRASSLLQELGRQPTNLEIADGMDITEDEVAKTMMISQVPRQHEPDTGRDHVREGVVGGDRGIAFVAEGAGVQDSPLVLRARRRRPDDARRYRDAAPDHARASAADQGKGAAQAAAQLA